jgi:hypothetical protein
MAGELAQARGDLLVAVARPQREVLAELDRPAVMARDAPARAAGSRQRG